MVDKLPKYGKCIITGRTIAAKSCVPAGVAMLPHHNMGSYEARHSAVVALLFPPSLPSLSEFIIQRTYCI